jgi:3-dehydroquinate dehydratase/shikimate dehydrogenase
MICIPITARTQREIVEEMISAARIADVVELRLDYAPKVALPELLQSCRGPVIVTCRPKRQGGIYEGPEDERIALLQKAVDLGADFVDVELDSASRIRRSGRTQIIVSHHDFEKVPDNVGAIHRELINAGANVAKIACMVHDIRDNLKLLALPQETKHRTIVLGMGEAGLPVRILGRKFGNFLTFASLTAGKESAPGQVTARDLIDLYRYRSIGPKTAVYGVIGNPIHHSMSPAIHNRAFAELGLDAVYLPLLVQCDVVEFIHAFKILEVRGYSVTVPHKLRAMEAMDDVDPIAGRIGAINTILHDGGKLFGANTDVAAAIAALEEALDADAPGHSPLQGRHVLMIGAGGAARAVAYGLIERGAHLIIANRTVERAEQLANDVGAQAVPLSEIEEIEADIIINTTTVGMHPKVDETPVPASMLHKGMVVFDAVYNPLETRLLREANAASCRTIPGLTWFIRQAAAQFELWTGKVAPVQVMEEVVRERLVVSS